MQQNTITPKSELQMLLEQETERNEARARTGNAKMKNGNKPNLNPIQ